MARLRVTRSVDPATADLLLAPRDDVVGERPAPGDGEGDGTRRYVLGDGPFERYERTVTAVPDGDGGAATATVNVTEDIDFRLPPATWRFLLTPAVRTALRRRP